MSALRATACAGVLVGVLILGGGAAGVAFADPGAPAQGPGDEQSSKGVESEQAGQTHETHESVGEREGSEHESAYGAGESNVATFSDVTEPAPEAAPNIERGADPGTEGGVGTEGTDPGGGSDSVGSPDTDGGGSDYVDNTVVSLEPELENKPTGFIGYPFPYYLLELRRRGGGDWWNGDRILSRYQEVVSHYLPMPPEPTPAPAPAFRGGAPEPEPVLDASGGVAGGGSDYQATGFDGAPVLQAPIIAAPALPAAAARFPSAPPAAAPGSAAPRGAGAEPGSANQGTRSGGTPEELPAGTVTSMSGQTPRHGYTDYLRSPGLPQLAGAALPGIAGILLLTVGGGVIGYRQASAGRMVRMTAAARYLP